MTAVTSCLHGVPPPSAWPTFPGATVGLFKRRSEPGVHPSRTVQGLLLTSSTSPEPRASPSPAAPSSPSLHPSSFLHLGVLLAPPGCSPPHPPVAGSFPESSSQLKRRLLTEARSPSPLHRASPAQSTTAKNVRARCPARVPTACLPTRTVLRQGHLPCSRLGTPGPRGPPPAAGAQPTLAE